MSKTVLIVEDNELNMKLFNDLLQAHGISTLLTFHYVALGWVWFALPSLGLSLATFARLFGAGG